MLLAVLVSKRLIPIFIGCPLLLIIAPIFPVFFFTFLTNFPMKWKWLFFKALWTNFFYLNDFAHMLLNPESTPLFYP